MKDKINYKNVVENDFEIDFYKETRMKILEYLRSNSKAKFHEIIKNVQGSDRRVMRLLNELVENGEIKLSGSDIYLARRDGDVIKKPSFSNIRNKLIAISKSRPIPTFLFDQRPVTLDTTLRRAIYLYERGDLYDKSIALVGDDDLTSLALGFTRLPREIVVFDIDKRLLAFIKKVAAEHNLPISTVYIDLSKKLPNKYRERFDVFLTDPTPNLAAFRLFISAGLCLLKKGKGFVGYVSFFPSHQPISLGFQRILDRSNLIITDIIPKFTDYQVIKQTYRDSDYIILNKFGIVNSDLSLSFYENLTRFITTSQTPRKIATIKNGKALFGRASKRALKSPNKDPAYSSGDSYVIKLSKKMRGANDK